MNPLIKATCVLTNNSTYHNINVKQKQKAKHLLLNTTHTTNKRRYEIQVSVHNSLLVFPVLTFPHPPPLYQSKVYICSLFNPVLSPRLLLSPPPTLRPFSSYFSSLIITSSFHFSVSISTSTPPPSPSFFYSFLPLLRSLPGVVQGTTSGSSLKQNHDFLPQLSLAFLPC